MTPAQTALYIHWPFCLSKCPYCDFNSHVRDSIDQARWRKALLADLDRAADEGEPRTLVSIFFGGGTPSLMDPETVAALIDRATTRWPADSNIEITLEANPTSVETGRLAGYRTAGVNRVSLGVQALDDASLRFLGREHSAADALRAVEAAQSIFDRYSFDLIYGRPGQTPDAWEAELTNAIDRAGDHLSLYQLTLEPKTAFFRRAAAGEALILDEDGTAELYEITQAMMNSAGIPAYEISNHARPGSECRHNLVYWRYDDYAGIGPGAHGRVTTGGEKVATRRLRSPETWLEALEGSRADLVERTVVTPEEQITEAIMMGLRLAEGIPLSRIEALSTGTSKPAVAPGRVADLVEGGFLDPAPDLLRATVAGRQRLDAVLAHLLA